MGIRRVSMVGGGLLIVGALFWYSYARVFAFGGHHVQLPPVDASPKRVVTTYIDALNGHDCETARRLWVANAPVVMPPDVWVSHPRAEIGVLVQERGEADEREVGSVRATARTRPADGGRRRDLQREMAPLRQRREHRARPDHVGI